MGDRGNIIVDGVYLYTHWRGSDLLDTLHAALKRRQRWDDGPYLTRMIFCEMVKGDIGGEADFGISLSPPDNEHPLVFVDTATQTIRLEDCDKPISFDDFVNSDDLKRLIQFRGFYEE